jgi:hypothetical protein
LGLSERLHRLRAVLDSLCKHRRRLIFASQRSLEGGPGEPHECEAVAKALRTQELEGVACVVWPACRLHAHVAEPDTEEGFVTGASRARQEPRGVVVQASEVGGHGSCCFRTHWCSNTRLLCTQHRQPRRRRLRLSTDGGDEAQPLRVLSGENGCRACSVASACAAQQRSRLCDVRLQRALPATPPSTSRATGLARRCLGLLRGRQRKRQRGTYVLRAQGGRRESVENRGVARTDRAHDEVGACPEDGRHHAGACVRVQLVRHTSRPARLTALGSVARGVAAMPSAGGSFSWSTAGTRWGSGVVMDQKERGPLQR